MSKKYVDLDELEAAYRKMMADQLAAARSRPDADREMLDLHEQHLDLLVLYQRWLADAFNNDRDPELVAATIASTAATMVSSLISNAAPESAAPIERAEVIQMMCREIFEQAFSMQGGPKAPNVLNARGMIDRHSRQ